MLTIEDAKTLDESEWRQLARLLYLVLCDLRGMARDGKNAEVRALADALHEVPQMMYPDKFSIQMFRDGVARFQNQFPGKAHFNYLQEWEKLQNQGPK